MRVPCLIALVAISICGCGGGGEGESGARGTEAAADAVQQDRPKQPGSEYEEVLLDLRQAAEAGENYDAYGFAEYMPASQRAALDAFCFVAEALLDGGEVERFGEAGYVDRRVAAQAKLEFDYGAPGGISSEQMATTRQAIRKLRSIVDLEAIDEELVGNYVAACYNRG
jgi:hypothetical protein